MSTHKYPALHNAMWPGLVGKGSDSEPPIDLDTMLNMTASADVDGVKFDGIDIFHAAPHTNIDQHHHYSRHPPAYVGRIENRDICRIRVGE